MRLLQELILFRNVSSSAATTKIDLIHRQWLHCGHYKIWSYSPTVAPLQLLEELILFPEGGSTAAITWTNPIHRLWLHYYKNWSYSLTVAPLRPLPELILQSGNGAAAAFFKKTDPIRRRWLHCGHYLNWSCSPAMEPLRAILMSWVMQARLSLPCKQRKVRGGTSSDRLISR